MGSQVTSAPYTKAVVAAMRKLYPEALADHSFDNTGILLEAPFNPSRRQKNSVLLTIDLTRAVADEAIRRKDSCIVSYHPIIFRGLKSLTLEDSQQQSLLRLAAEGITVYSPHTAVDSASGGLNDWLADLVCGEAASTTSTDANADDTRPTYQLRHHPSQLSIKQQKHDDTSKNERRPIKKINVSGMDGTGIGRIVQLEEAVPLTKIIDRIARGMGNPKAMPVAIPQGKQASEMMIRTVGICAGSGGGVFPDIEKSGDKVDLLFTGELSHHETLAAIEKGQCVIALFHSNSERGFLYSVMKGQLERTIPHEFKEIREELKGQGYDEALSDESSEVHVSEVDRDPYGIMIRN